MTQLALELRSAPVHSSLAQACWFARVRMPEFGDGVFDRAAERYVHEHPDAWVLFCTFARQLTDAGVKRAGAKAIVERIRWERRTSAHGVGRDYAWDNTLTTPIARAWARAYPGHDLFTFRGGNS